MGQESAGDRSHDPEPRFKAAQTQLSREEQREEGKDEIAPSRDDLERKDGPDRRWKTTKPTHEMSNESHRVPGSGELTFAEGNHLDRLQVPS